MSVRDLVLPAAALILLATCGLLDRSRADEQPAPAELFADVTRSAGINWQHFNGESPDRLLIEAMSGGVAFLDFDQDGRLDIFLVNGGETPRGKSRAPVRNGLYRNLGNGTFEDVANRAGVDRVPFYGMGVAVGDYDNDGFPDLFVTGYPECALLHNHGNGTFTDKTEKAGVRNAGGWAASAAWFDYDRDGLLDLVVCNYARLSLDNPKRCEYKGTPTYCEQKAYEGLPLALYHNNGNGTFTDASTKSGLEKQVGRALGVVSIDVDGDGWPDLFVARDASPNLLLINRHDGTFEDSAFDAEVAFDTNGNAKAGMGVDAGDINGDGLPDFVITNFNDEYHSLFLGRRPFPYEDWTRRSSLARFTQNYVGWGTHFIDYDNDGKLDLVIANGHVNPTIEMMRDKVTYREPPLLLHNEGTGLLSDVHEVAGKAFNTSYDARGLAVGDFDGDGRQDLIFTCLSGSPVLARNNAGQGNAWIGFELVGTKSNRDAIGAKLTLRAGKQTFVRWITGGSSYLSSSDKRVVFGIPAALASAPLDLAIVWPSGIAQHAANVTPLRYNRIVEPTAR